MPTIFSIVGKANSGKTTLITKIVCELKSRGFSVGVMKHCPGGFELDREGKDSWAFTQAGADGVLLVSPQKIGLIKETKEKFELYRIANRFLGNADFILVEGFRDAKNVNKIEVLRSCVSGELYLPASKLVAVVSDFDTGLDLRQFTHDDISAIVDFMEKYMDKNIEKKEVLPQVELKINGKDISLNPFVQKVLQNVNLGVIKALKTEVEEPKDIEIRIREE